MKSILEKSKRVVLKIGSGVLTSEDGIRPRFFSGIAREIKQLQEKGIEVILVSSGAIACGMAQQGLTKRPKEIDQKQAIAAIGQPFLMHHYHKSFSRYGLQVAQILITRDDLHNPHRFLTARHALYALIRRRVIPVVNENDTVAVEEIKFGDNDQLSAQIAHLVHADLLIILTDIDGLFDRDPKKFKDATRIPLVEKIDTKHLSYAGHTMNTRSVGGMITKLAAAKQAASYGIPTWILNGMNPKTISQLFSGKDLGTLFLPK